MNGFSSRWRTLPLLFVSVLALGACDNPVGSGGGHPEGLVVTNSQGVEVARYLELTNTSTGRITVARGSSETFRMHLLTRDGSRVDLDGIEYSVDQATVLTGLLATATLSDADGVTITGNSAGQTGDTRLFLDVWHGNHPEFEAEINLRVE